MTKADVAEQRGAGFVNRIMLVRIQSSALHKEYGRKGRLERRTQIFANRRQSSY